MRDTLGGRSDKLAHRRRLPRAIRGDRVLTPYAAVPALGQALLQATMAAAAAQQQQQGGGRRSPAPGGGGGGGGVGPGGGFGGAAAGLDDLYEWHISLPGGNVAIVTDRRLALVASEAFAQLEADVAAGRRRGGADDIPAGALKWQLPWDQMLTAELAYHRQSPGAPPDGVIVHRKYRDAADALVYDVRCRAATRQAQDLHAAIGAARAKYYLDPRREARGWKVAPVTAAERRRDQAMPGAMPCLDFKRVWAPGARAGAGGGAGDSGASGGAAVISVWRPVGPPGYHALGDVAMPGLEPPARPVTVYREDAPPASPTAGDGADGAGGTAAAPASASAPRLAAPVGYQLVFRDSMGGGHGVSIWRPVPPKGYAEVGHVVVPAIEEPPPGAARCVRADLLRHARLYDAPVWQGASADNAYWRCAIWQVDNQCGTFVAVKTAGRPHPRQALAPKF